MAYSDHTGTTAPVVSGDLLQTGEDLPAEGNGLFSGPRSWRGRTQLGTSTDAPGMPLDTTKDNRPQVHLSRGVPDPRRGELTELPPTELAAAPETATNQRTQVVENPTAPPDRARQGWTGADPTRPSLMQRPIFTRPFDKAIAEHAGELTKDEMPAPLAAHSKQLGDLSGALPYAGGQTGTQRAGIGPTPNTFRIMPKPWDALLVNTGGPAVSPDTPDPAYAALAARGRAFR